MTEVEDEERKRKVITFFHNLKGVDGNFVVETLYDQGRSVDNPLTQRAKSVYFESGVLVCKDSLNLFATPLEKFPATFNLTELHKGFFSHAFNREEIFNYSGSYPPMAEHDPDGMNDKKRKEFMTWYRQKVDRNSTLWNCWKKGALHSSENLKKLPCLTPSFNQWPLPQRMTTSGEKKSCKKIWSPSSLKEDGMATILTKVKLPFNGCTSRTIWEAA